MKPNMGTRLARIKSRIATLIFFARIGWGLSRMANAYTKCAECRCSLHVTFTGVHEMAKGTKRKVVCGLCSSQLELKGWHVIPKIK